MKADDLPLLSRRVFGKPLFIAALVALALNDHVFKGSGVLPGWLTGKLSDVAGLFVAAPLLGWMVRARTRRGHIAAHLAVALGFGVLEMSSVATSLVRTVFEGVGLSWASWSDPTNLLALMVLPLSYAYVLATNVGPTAKPRAANRRRTLVEYAIATASLVACIATAPAAPPPATCDETTLDCDQDGWNLPEDCDDYDPNVKPGVDECPLGPEASCDDGDDNDHDSQIDCRDPDCALVCGDVIAACNGTVAIDISTVTALEGNTVGGTNATDASCIGADAPERIYSITAPSTGIVRLTSDDAGIVARTDCLDSHNQEVSCVQPEDGTATLDMTAGTPVIVIIEASDGLEAGPFLVAVEWVPFVCGDGIVAGAEECDDMNTVSGDGCSAACQVEAAE